jgi:hypothetical protein
MTFGEIIVVFVVVSFFISIWLFLFKKKDKEAVKIFEEKVKLLEGQILEHEIKKAQLAEEYKQKQFAWDDQVARKEFELQQLQKDNEEHIVKDRLLQEKYDKELHFRKSSEVRLGMVYNLMMMKSYLLK